LSAGSGQAGTSSTVGTGGSSAGSRTGTSSTVGTGGSAAGARTGTFSTVGTGGSAAGGNTGMSNSGTDKKRGLDRADEVAGRHGKQGRKNAREKNKNF
jgi:hypothetical protein